MRRFQQQYHIEADGKLTALSVIALGLGPKRKSTSSLLPASVAPPATAATGDSTGSATPE
jgi:hypothetical protein